MQTKYKKLSNYELVGKLIEELKFRKMPSTELERKDIVIKFLKLGKKSERTLLSYFNKSGSLCVVFTCLEILLRECIKSEI